MNNLFICVTLIFLSIIFNLLKVNAQENSNLFSNSEVYVQNNYIDLEDENGDPIFDSPIQPDSLLMTGEAPTNGFGHSAASAGDVNNDGYDDVIVGAYGYNVNLGKVYIFYGGATMNNVADLTFTESTVYFGYRVSTAGDVNNDGYSDVLVGTVSEGRVYIYYGGASMNTTADLILQDINDVTFGISVSSAGDVNGDGYSDVIIGADGYLNYTGRAYIFFGGLSMNNVADVIITGGAANDRLGISVSSAGNVNGDIYSDVIVGAHGYNYNTGRAYIFYGGAFMNNFADVTFTGEAVTNYFGVSVSSAGKVNGDNYSDVVIGAQGYGAVRGRAYVYYGGSLMNNVPDVIMNGEGENNFFGNSVAAAGDVNGDGFSDLVIGAEGFNSNTGRAYIFYGGVSMNNVPDLVKTGEAENDKFGHSVSTSGDLRGDGFADIIVGAYDYNLTTGRTYVYMKKPTVEVNLKVLIEGMYYPLFNSMARKETLKLYLRQSASPYGILDSAQSQIDSISFTGNFLFVSISTGKYYLVAKHFNSVETWSRTGGDSLRKGIIVNNYDYTTSSSQAYGNNLKFKGSKYCIYSGDVDRNAIVDVGDLLMIYNQSILFTTGNFLPQDLNADLIVDVNDVTLCYNNVRNFVTLIRP